MFLTFNINSGVINANLKRPLCKRGRARGLDLENERFLKG